MKAVCWNGVNDLNVETVPDPEIVQPRDAVLSVTMSTTCGSDLHFIDGYIPTMRAGDVIGHEFMGEVVDVGKEVKRVKKGDRVVVPSFISCEKCWYCDHDLWSLCDNTNPNADMQVGFLSDAGPTGFMGAEFCNLRGGEMVAVWGAGGVGQMAMRGAQLLGAQLLCAERVIATDRFPERLSMAEKQLRVETINYEKVERTRDAEYDDRWTQPRRLQRRGGKGGARYRASVQIRSRETGVAHGD
jgi:threonine dehydrogenase-like Zn-dependent dehydrogenase